MILNAVDHFTVIQSRVFLRQMAIERSFPPESLYSIDQLMGFHYFGFDIILDSV